MQVKAIRIGFLNYFREEGDVFECEDSQFSPTWMVQADQAVDQVPEQPVDQPADQVESPSSKRRGRARSADDVI